MTIEWNKVTWYSMLIAVIVFVLTFYVGFSLGFDFGKETVNTYNINTLPKTSGQNLSQIYSNKTEGFSISYPSGYVVDESYVYQALGPGRDINGVKFTIPASVSIGTNLGADSYISVESFPSAINSCSAEIYLSNPKSAGFVDENGHRYSVATSSGAGAGNRYDEKVYATSVTGGCIAVRYFIHYGVFENYPAGTIKKFDEQVLMNKFDAIRQTLVLN